MQAGLYRIGHGFDVHAFAPGRKLILLGCDIEYEQGLHGHSDADVATHAIMDSLLGALGLDDIGIHFPDSDSNYKDSNSISLLKSVIQTMKDYGYCLSNLDITIIAQQPKLSGYRESMKHVLVDTFQCESNQINVKFTTTEHLGYIGRGEGIAAHCVTILEQIPTS